MSNGPTLMDKTWTGRFATNEKINLKGVEFAVAVIQHDNQNPPPMMTLVPVGWTGKELQRRSARRKALRKKGKN